MTNTNQKQASEFDNFTYNIAPEFEDGFYGYAVDKDFNMSIVQMYLDCETEEEVKKVDRALSKLRNFLLSMDRGHLKNKAKYMGEEMFKESNFKEFVRKQDEKYSPKTSETNSASESRGETVSRTASGTETKSEDQLQQIPTRVTRQIKVDTPASSEITTKGAQKSNSGDSNEVTEEEFQRRLAEERSKWEQQQAQQVVVMNNLEYEKAVAMKRLEGLTGLKRAAMAATIDRYFNDRQTFENAYKDDPNMKFAYTLDDYINGARYNIETK